MSNWFIRAKSAQEKKKKFDLPQKQSVSKAKLGRTCVILSSCRSRRPQGKRLKRERIHTRKHSTHLRAAIFISLSRLVSTIKKTNKVIIFGQTADQISVVMSISSVFCGRVSL